MAAIKKLKTKQEKKKCINGGNNKQLLATIYKNNAGKLGLGTLSQFVIFGNIIKK